jgi:hypothetical protein
MPREGCARQLPRTNVDGFRRHAVRLEANDRKRLEQPCRHIAHSRLSNARIPLTAPGPIELKLMTTWRHGTTPQVMSPLAFMQRLVALVSRPRLHLIRFIRAGAKS